MNFETNKCKKKLWSSLNKTHYRHACMDVYECYVIFRISTAASPVSSSYSINFFTHNRNKFNGYENKIKKIVGYKNFSAIHSMT